LREQWEGLEKIARNILGWIVLLPKSTATSIKNPPNRYGLGDKVVPRGLGTHAQRERMSTGNNYFIANPDYP
jgi:hypothetical protein